MKRAVVKELGEQLRLAAPLAAVNAGQQLLSVVDTAVVGRLGGVEIGAVGLGHAVFNFLLVLGLGVMLGFDPLTSQALGAGDALRARKLMWQAIWMSLVVGVFATLPMLMSEAFLSELHLEQETARQTALYLAARAPGLLPLFTFFALRGYLQALGSTRPMILGMIVANICNAIMATLLTLGGGILPGWTGVLRAIPSLGVVGAGISTSLCIVLQVVILIFAVRAHPVAAMTPQMRRVDEREMRRAFKVGLPISFQMGAEVGVFSLAGVLAGRLGVVELAAHQIAITVASFSFMFALGVGTAGSVRVGRAIGARDPGAVRLAGLCSFAFGGGFMVYSAFLLWMFPYEFVGLLTNQPDVIEMSVRLLVVAAVFQVSDGIQAVGAGVLRGAGDTRFLSIANIIAHYFIGLPVAGVLAYVVGMGIIGIWWGLCLGLIVVAVSLFVRFMMLSRHLIEPLVSPDARNH